MTSANRMIDFNFREYFDDNNIHDKELQNVLQSDCPLERKLALLNSIAHDRQLLLNKSCTEEDANLCASSYIALGSIYLQGDQIIRAFENFDKALILIGPKSSILHLIESMETKYREFLDNHNNQTFTKYQNNDNIPSISRENFPDTLVQISVDDFIRMKDKNLPFLLKEYLDWPALQKWSEPSFWVKNHGHRIVPIEVGGSYIEDDWDQQLMSIGQSFSQMFDPENTKILYLAQHCLLSQVPSLEEDISIPPFSLLTDDSIIKNIWIGMKGTRTPLHTDPYNNLFSQVEGYKHMILVNPKYSKYISVGPDATNTSTLELNDDSLSINFPFYSFILRPGDLLFIPKGWWHMVLGKSWNVSVSMWFD